VQRRADSLGAEFLAGGPRIFLGCNRRFTKIQMTAPRETTADNADGGHRDRQACRLALRLAGNLPGMGVSLENTRFP